MRLLAILIFFPSFCYGGDELRNQIRKYTISIHCDDYNGNVCNGSGVLLDNQEVLTAYHVIENVNKRLEEIKKDDKSYSKIPQIFAIERIIEDGKHVGDLRYLIEIIYINKESDLALLKLKTKSLKDFSTIRESKDLLPIDTVLYHCGNFRGSYPKIVSKGYLQGYDYIDSRPKQTSDLADFTTYPGSSGGGVWTENGDLVGIVIQRHGQNLSFFVPSRIINDWLEKERNKKK